MKIPEIFYLEIIEIWPKGLDDAVKDYCKTVLKMTYEEKRRQIIDDFRMKLFNAAIEYKETKQEMKNEQNRQT